MIQAMFIPGNEDLTKCFAIRREVFIEEQNCPEEEEFDGKDLYALHALVLDSGEPVGTARIYFEDADTIRLGRVAVKKEMRGKHIGDLLVRLALFRIMEIDCKKVTISAQCDKTGFYAKYGFQVTSSESYMEAGIPHVMMELPKEKISLEHQCTGCGACGKAKQ